MKFLCSGCGYPYPEDRTPFRCPTCSGIFDLAHPIRYDRGQIIHRSQGLLKFGGLLDFPELLEGTTLGEGATPLMPVRMRGSQVLLKCEHLNPTGSYKDRGSVTLVTYLRQRKIPEVIEDSSGNAGASLAAYAAHAGIRCSIFIPTSSSGPKRVQIENYGAKIQLIPGPRERAAEAVLQEASLGKTYASHAFLPFGLPGIATIVWEVYEELGELPGSIVCPVGHGGLLLGVYHGCRSIHDSLNNQKMPFFLGVQSKSCAPIANAFSGDGRIHVPEKPDAWTKAEGIRVANPAHGQQILALLRKCPGSIETVDDEEIIDSQAEMAEQGFFVEPTSATVWAAVQHANLKLPEPVLLILTGSGLKYMPA